MVINPKLRNFLHSLAEKLDILHTNQKLTSMERTIKALETEQKELHSLLYEFLDPALYPHAVKQWYQNKTGSVLDLDDPKTYNEKIQWMKVYDKDPRKTLLSDKYLVRDWVKEKIGEQYLMKLIAVYNRAEKINFDELPDTFIIKANHGSGMNLIVRDKNREDLEAVRRKAAEWLKTNFAFAHGFELQYNDIPRRIIVEEYHENEGDVLKDYKFWCFDGKCRFINYIIDRNKGTRSGLYDLEWNRLPFTPGAFTPIKEEIPMPEKIPEMVKIAETLADGFPHVRVDLYKLDDGSIKFGEMTFTTSTGLCRWNPPEADQWVGDMFTLPEKSLQNPAESC